MAVKQFITQKEFAARMGIANSTASQMCYAQIKGAFNEVTKKIDYNHESVIMYMRRRNLKDHTFKLHYLDTYQAPIETEQDSEAEPEIKNINLEETLQRLKNYRHLTVEEVLREYGTVSALSDFITAIKKLLDIEERALRVEKMAGDLISREFVKKYIIGYIESSHVDLLNNVPKKIVIQTQAAVKSNTPLEIMVENVTSIISKSLKDVKTKVINSIEK